jgi:hypothetical protein
MNFIDYSEIAYNAFGFSSKQQETAKRKQDIIDTVVAHYGVKPRSVLFVGFNPAILNYDSSVSVTVTQVTDDILDYLRQHNPAIKNLAWDHALPGEDSFDLVVAMDEFLTFAETETEQQANLSKICNLASSLVITTLRDYKNQSFKDREFSIPSVVKGETSDRIYLEYHDYDQQDRNAWIRNVYEISGSTLGSWQGFNCRQMFFKQCAKFSIDAGAQDFLIHKNIMYKSLIKKNYEHVISIRFSNNGRKQPSRQYSQ